MSVPIIPRNSYRVTVLSSSTAETAQQEPEIKNQEDFILCTNRKNPQRNARL